MFQTQAHPWKACENLGSDAMRLSRSRTSVFITGGWVVLTLLGKDHTLKGMVAMLHRELKGLG